MSESSSRRRAAFEAGLDLNDLIWWTGGEVTVADVREAINAAAEPVPALAPAVCSVCRAALLTREPLPLCFDCTADALERRRGLA